jgi:beta-lactamase regulating signal transducer with metallopeptidase domain/DUF4097 and DUF4098 domain-containing protein YvlB
MTAFVLVFLAKLTLVLALGLSVVSVLRSSAPSVRHLVLLATVACGLALPLAAVTLPQWRVAVLPAVANVAPSLARVITNESPQVQNATTQTVPLVQDQPTLRIAPFDFARGRQDNSASPNALMIAWMLGFVAMAGWLAIGRLRLRHIRSGAWPLADAEWSRIMDDERRSAGVEHAVCLYSSSVVSTPLTWGSRVPVILLPEDAVDWPEAHRRIVLRHELAHIARHDSLTQLIAGVACAMYWFHPLAWMTERRLRAECERACDDRVVSLGTPAAEYAAHLLEVARSARSFGAAGFMSAAMARPTQLEGRLLAVLSDSRTRMSTSRWARPVVAVAAMSVLLPLAAFRPVPATVRVTAAAPLQSASQVATPIMVNGGVARSPKDTTFDLTGSGALGGILRVDLKTGGAVTIIGTNENEVRVHATLAGRNWRETVVTLVVDESGTHVSSRYTGSEASASFKHDFEIRVPKKFDVRITSAGGGIAIRDVDGSFSGHTGGGAITLERANGDAHLTTGGGDIRVADSHLDGHVTTGAGVVRYANVTGNLDASSGTGTQIHTRSTEMGASAGIGSAASYSSPSSVTATSITTSRSVAIADDSRPHIGTSSATGSSSSVFVGTGTKAPFAIRRGNGFGYGYGEGSTTTSFTDRGGVSSSFGANGIRMNLAGGPISIPAAPDGARLLTGGGEIRVGPSAGEIFAQTGGGPITIERARGSVAAHTGAGAVSVTLEGATEHMVDVTSGKGDVVLTLPANIDATLELETAYTESFGHATEIVSDWKLPTAITERWDSSEGTPRRYVRAQHELGRGGAVIRVRTVNGNIVVRRG